MSKELDAKLKTALDKSRLLILGAQVLFGFAFQAAFQELFAEIDTAGRTVQLAALGLLTLSVALLIVPSLYHQIACRGRTLHAALRVATSFAGWSLLPLTLGLGASAYVVFERFAGIEVGLIFGGALAGTGIFLLYGLGFALRKTPKPPPPEGETSLKTKIEQLLTEARVIIPGGQALLGFQFVATLTKAFETLPQAMKWVHTAALAAVGLSVLLLMTPAALHRLAFHGEDDPQFSKPPRGLWSPLPCRWLSGFPATSLSSVQNHRKRLGFFHLGGGGSHRLPGRMVHVPSALAKTLNRGERAAFQTARHGTPISTVA